MRKSILTALLIVSIASIAQNKKEERKEATRIAATKIKSVTQTEFEFVFDMKTKTKKPAATGVKISTVTYDTKGNTTQEISYNQFGAVETKTNYKLDARGNQTEISVYGSDGALQSKMGVEYNADTATLIKVYGADGNLSYTNFTSMESAEENGNKVCNLFSYSSKDSTLVASQKSVYDKSGNLIDYYEYEGRYLTGRVSYNYNEAGNISEQKFYDKNNYVTGSQKFKYDAKGNLIEVQNCGAYGIAYSTTVYKNDAKGNYTESTVYLDNDVKKQKALYRYKYENYPAK